MKEDVAIIIPAYNPTQILEELVENLNKAGYKKIIVVNDGSKSEEIFKKIKANAIILKHKKNLGKGTALKTGFKYCINNIKEITSVITVDADGQHLIKDINNVYEKCLENSKSLILGSRRLKEKVPLRSLFGNRIMSMVFKHKTKFKIQDTQTGLRAIPFIYLKDFCNISGDRFEYEINMLLYATNKKLQIIEEPIESVYINKNKSSNFKAIKDSLKIILEVIKY